MSEIVLDTSAVIPDFRLQGPAWGALLATARDLRDSVLIPALVVDELVNKFRERVDEATKEINHGLEGLARLTPFAAPALPQTTAIATDYERWLHQELARSRVVVPEYPKVTHERVVKRALQRRKPFCSEGQRGYRDALLWETVKAILFDTDEDVLLVTRNSRDFLDPGGRGLHDDLLTDLLVHDIESNRVRAFNGIKDLLDQGLLPKTQLLPELVARAKDFILGKTDLREWVPTELLTLLNAAPPLLSDLDVFDAEMPEGWEFAAVELQSPPTLHRASTIQDDLIYVTLTLEIRARLRTTQVSLFGDESPRSLTLECGAICAVTISTGEIDGFEIQSLDKTEGNWPEGFWPNPRFRGITRR